MRQSTDNVHLLDLYADSPIMLSAVGALVLPSLHSLLNTNRLDCIAYTYA